MSREIDELTDKIETDAKREIALKQRDFETSLKELEQELKQYKPQQFSKPPITQSIETQLKDIQQDLDDYLDDPFSTTSFFETGVAKSKRLRETLEAELRDVDSKLSQPELFKRKTAEIEKKLTILEDEFKKALVKQQQLKQDAINNLKLRVETELSLLQNMKPEDIVNETGLSRETVDVLLKEKEAWIEKYNTFLKRKNFGVESPFQRKVRRFKTDVRNSYSTSRYRGEQQLAQLRSYREQLIGLRSNIDRVPDKKWKLSRAQRSRLAETENFRNLYGQYYPRLVDKIGELERYNNEFAQRYAEYADGLNQSIDSIFSNDFLTNYTKRLTQEADSATRLYDDVEKNLKILEKVRKPGSWEEYVEVLNDGVQDATNLTKAMRAKRAILNGVNGKPGVVKQLQTDIQRINQALKNANGKGYTNFYTNQLIEKQQQLEQLMVEYRDKQSQLLTQIERLYKRSVDDGDVGTDVNAFLYSKTVLDEQMRTGMRNRIGSQLSRIMDYETAVGAQQSAINFARQHVDEIAKLKVEYEVVPKIDGSINTTPGLTRYRPTLLTADNTLQVKRIVNVDVDVNNDIVPDITDKLKKVRKLTQNYRNDIAPIYYAIEDNGLKLEGKDSLFSKLEKSQDMDVLERTLSEKELAFVKGLDKRQRLTLLTFAKDGLYKEFEKLYYTNSVGYLLRHNIGDFVIPQEVGDKLSLGQNELLGKAQQILGGRNRNKSLLYSKSNEVRKAVKELNDVLERLGEKPVRVTAYITDSSGKQVLSQGFLTAQNLPKLEAESPLNLNERLLKKAQELTGLDKKSVIITEDDTIRVRNQLTRRLMSLLGVTENGTPFTDPTLIQQLSGMGVRSREDLLKLIDQIEGGLYRRSSLNTLLAANQRNFNEARKQGDALYMYNFNREDDVVYLGG